MHQPFLMKFPQARTLKTNVIYCADNLEVMKQLPSESIDLIYIDPPFNTGTVRKSKAWDQEVQLGDFDDKWGGINSYVLWMTNRLREMHRLLKPTGVLCVHLDYRSVHYIKVELDKIFGSGQADKGSKHFVNEIVWCYSQGGRSKKTFAKKHDTILIHSKTKNSYYFNPIKIPMDSGTKSFGGRLETDKDGRKFRLVYGSKDKNGKSKYYKYYLDEGKIPEDYWTDINSIQSGSKERIGYPTQKPIELLDRFIKSFTNENDIVADFFCGCATTLSSAQGLNRKWLGVDVSKEASKVIRKRMARDHKMKVEIVPLKSLTKAQVLRLNPFEFEKYVVRSIGGIPNSVQRGDGGIDDYLQEDGTPIQVKKSDKVGRTVIDSFHKHLQKNGKGIIIAKSFGRGAKEEVSRLRLKEGYDVTLVTVDDILRDVS